MRLRTGVLLASLGCFGMHAPASADNAKVGRLMLRDFAKCAVKHEPELVKKFVLGGPTGSLSQNDLQRVFDPRCFGLWRTSFRANGLALRAAFAEALVQKHLKQWPDLDPSVVDPLNWTIPDLKPGRIHPTLPRKIEESIVEDARVGPLGECVVRASPTGAAAVLNTKVDSQAELAALKALTAQIAVCVKAGETAVFNRTNLRHGIALSYYRLANVPRTAGKERG